MAKISSEEKVFCEFPSNLRVLAIDTDPAVLEFINKICNEYCYEVITCMESLRGTIILQENKLSIDLVLMEVHMPDMDGYEFLLANQEIDVPKIMMSLDDNTKSVMKTIKLGACDYMIKPLHEDRLRNIWTHVVRKSLSEKNKMRKNIGNSLEDDNQNSKSVFSSGVEIPREVHDNVGESPSSKKKPRIVWTTELHGKFVKAVNQIGLANAVPNKILELMNTPTLTRNNVASHLQKYRNVLKTKSSREKERQAEPKREYQSVSDIQMDNHHEEQVFGLELSDPLAIYPNIAISQNFSQALDSGYGVWSPYNAVLAENQVMQQQQQQQKNMQSSLMQNQVSSINFQPSSMMISENPYLVTQNDNFGRNIDHRTIQ